jgi:hypothetical protein
MVSSGEAPGPGDEAGLPSDRGIAREMVVDGCRDVCAGCSNSDLGMFAMIRGPPLVGLAVMLGELSQLFVSFPSDWVGGAGMSMWSMCRDSRCRVFRCCWVSIAVAGDWKKSWLCQEEVKGNACFTRPLSRSFQNTPRCAATPRSLHLPSLTMSSSGSSHYQLSSSKSSRYY